MSIQDDGIRVFLFAGMAGDATAFRTRGEHVWRGLFVQLLEESYTVDIQFVTTACKFM